MQTIESIRKTNELSKVLKQHGFAADTFEAMTQAQGIVDEPTTVLESAPPKIEEDASVKEPTNFDNKIASLERSKHLLSGRVDALQKELEKTQDHLKQVLLRLDGTESRLRSHARQSAPSQSAASQEASRPAQEQEQSQGHLASQEPQQVQEETKTREITQESSQEEKPMSETKKQQLDSSLSVENVFYSGTR